MKHILFLILLIAGVQAFGQTPSVTIIPSSQSTCSGGFATFTAFVINDTNQYTLTWKRNGTIVTDQDTVPGILNLTNITYADSGGYTVTVESSQGSYTSDTAFLHVRPALTIDTLYRYNALGCPGTCKGQMRVSVSGGNPPYDYFWGAGNSQDTIVTSLCKGKYLLSVYDSDSSHCISREYKVEVLTLPKISFTKSSDTIFLTNPTLTVMFPDTSAQHLSNWEWTFFEGKNDSTVVQNLNPATHSYRKTGTFAIRLQFTDVNGCDSTIFDSIPVKLVELKIPDVFTPYEGSPNRTFVIRVKNAKDKTINDVFLENELVILSRWGNVVYRKKNYHSTFSEGEWDGGTLAEGVYFYIFTGHGFYGDEVFKGSVTIMGRNFSK